MSKSTLITHRGARLVERGQEGTEVQRGFGVHRDALVEPRRHGELVRLHVHQVVRVLVEGGVAVVGVVATLAVVAVAVRVGGHATRNAIYTLRQGDVVRDPLTATRCEATAEGGTPNLFCTRTMSRS